MPNTLVVFAVVLFTVCTASSIPSNFGEGSYVYDPNSIEQNEKILNLFVRLAAQTANQLMILKMKSNRNPIEYQDEVEEAHLLPEEEDPLQVPGLRILDEDEKRPSSVAEDSTEDPKALINVPEPTTLDYDILKNPETERKCEATTESEEESKSDDDLEAHERSADHQTPTPSSFRSFFCDKEAEEKRALSESELIVDEPTTVVYNVPWVPEPEDRAGVEAANRALFSFEKNNYVTHYTDQSTNIHKADTTVNNFGSGQLQEAGSSLTGNGGHGMSGQGSSIGGVAIGHPGITSLGESMMEKHAVAMTGNSASSASLNLVKTEATSGANSQSYKLANAQISGLNGGFVHAIGSVGIGGAEKIQSLGGLESGKEVRLQLMSNEKSPLVVDHDLHSTVHELVTSSKDGLHDIQSSGNLEGGYQPFHGEAGSSNKQEVITQGELNAQVTHSQEVKAGENRHQELSGFAVSSNKHDSLDVQHGLNAQAKYEGQVHHAAGSQNSGHSSSSSNASFGSGLSLGGQLNVGLEHSCEKKGLTNVEHGKLDSVSTGANLQTGSELDSLDVQHGLSAQANYEGQVHHAEGSQNSGHSSSSSHASFGSALNLANLQTGSKLDSLDVQHGLNAQANYEGQVHHAEGSQNSGHSSSSSNASFGSALSLGGQLNVGLEHSSEKKELTNFEHGKVGSVSTGASLQAGSKLEIQAGKGLSAGLGLLGEKISLFKGAIDSKAHFGGKLDVSAHVLAG